MGRRSVIGQYLGKQIGGIVILERLPNDGSDRLKVLCRCLECDRRFVAAFHNVYSGGYKSCGCIRHGLATKSPKWSGHGEISSSVFYAIKRGAEARNLEFDIAIEEIWELFLKQDRKCALSGQVLIFPKRRTDAKATASLDRIDASQGYVTNNLQWVHKDINYMKQQMNNEEFFRVVELIYKHRLQK